MILPDGSDFKFQLRKPDYRAKKKTVECGYPMNLYDNSLLQLAVQYLGGFDSEVKPGVGVAYLM